jgi:ring-1,2-phenylacetyl-CoA epoxidase subunit PaaC
VSDVTEQHLDAERDESVYAHLADSSDTRWAFGTGFADPLEGLDPTVPDGVDGADLAAACTMLADDALIWSHRLTEWATHGPELEAELALANVALDLLGQARMLYARAGQTDGTDRSEDDYAYLRTDAEFSNVRLTELPNGDFADCVVRMLVLSAWRLAVCTRLAETSDPVLAAVAAKAVPELRYHRDYAAGWVVRLGDGTPESTARTEAALEQVLPYVPELFEDSEAERRLAAAGAGVLASEVREEVDGVLAQVLDAAGLAVPEVAPAARVANRTGRDGVHTQALSYLLAELQSVRRQDPEATW